MKSTFGLVGRALANRAPVQYTNSRSPFFKSLGQGDRTAQLESMDATAALFSITSSLAADIARVDWKLYRKSSDRRRVYSYEGMDSRQEVVDHQALRVWNKPNPFMTQQEFVETVQLHYELTGEQWWVSSSASVNGVTLSFPTELWPVRPDRMDCVPDPEDYLAGYVYASPDGTKVPLTTEQVVFLRRPHPLDPYRGISAVSSVGWDLDADAAAARYNSNFFRNSAEPGGVIKAGKRLSPGEYADLKKMWDESHRGVGNSHRTAILSGTDLEYIPVTPSQRDMQFVELRGVSTEMVRLAYRYPKPMLGSVEDVNRANADAAEYVYAKWLMIDRLERIKQALNFEFLPLFGSAGEGVEFDYCSPVSEDREADNAELTAKVTAFQTLVNTGKVDPVAALEFLGLPTNMFLAPPEPVAAPVAPPQDQPVPGDQTVPAARLNGHTRPMLEV